MSLKVQVGAPLFDFFESLSELACEIVAGNNKDDLQAVTPFFNQLNSERL